MNNIGLDKTKTNELCDELNGLLSNYQVFYMNIRGFHWNIKGHKFFELHVKFEELYNNLLMKIDEIAERVLTLNGTPTHAYTDYINESEITEVRNVTDADSTVEELLKGLKILIKRQRQILDLSSEADDEGTNALMSDYIREQEKLVWMYSAFLK